MASFPPSTSRISCHDHKKTRRRYRSKRKPVNFFFYLASAVAIVSTLMVITRSNAVHALLYLVVSFLAIAVIFFVLGAPFIAALEVIIYAGAIMVLFVFVVMMLNPGRPTARRNRGMILRVWTGPSFLALILFVEFLIVLSGRSHALASRPVTPKDVGLSLFGPYLLGVELAAMLLLSGIVGALHLGQRKKSSAHRFFENGGPS